MKNKLSVYMSKGEFWAGWVLLVSELLLLPILLVLAAEWLNWSLNMAELNFVMFAVNFMLTLLVFRNFLLGNLKNAISQPFRLLRSAGLGLIVYFLGNLLVTYGILMVYPEFSNINDETIWEMARDNYTLISIGTVILVPIAEEALYRGLIFGSIRKKNRVLAYILSVVIFAMIHVAGYIGTAEPLVLGLCLLQYVPAGIALAWAYERADSIFAPILMHMTINQISMSLLR